jgi:hypothetical protein
MCGDGGWSVIGRLRLSLLMPGEAECRQCRLRLQFECLESKDPIRNTSNYPGVCGSCFSLMVSSFCSLLWRVRLTGTRLMLVKDKEQPLSDSPRKPLNKPKLQQQISRPRGGWIDLGSSDSYFAAHRAPPKLLLLWSAGIIRVSCLSIPTHRTVCCIVVCVSHMRPLRLPC